MVSSYNIILNKQTDIWNKRNEWTGNTHGQQHRYRQCDCLKTTDNVSSNVPNLLLPWWCLAVEQSSHPHWATHLHAFWHTRRTAYAMVGCWQRRKALPSANQTDNTWEQSILLTKKCPHRYQHLFIRSNKMFKIFCCNFHWFLWQDKDSISQFIGINKLLIWRDDRLAACRY